MKKMARFFSEIPLRTALLFLVTMSAVSFVFFGLYVVYFTGSHDATSESINDGQKLIRETQDAQNKVRQLIFKVEEERRNLSRLTKGDNVDGVLSARTSGNRKNNAEVEAIDLSKYPPVNYDVHIFYYPWYKSYAIDGKYAHWNHEQLPHWSQHSQMRKRQYVPPDDIGANFYPKLGPYSSADPNVIEVHMQQIRSMGVGVLSVSWYPPHYERSKETPVDDLMLPLFDSAAKYGLKIAFHIEPYEHRSGETLNKVVKFVVDKYGNHSAFYRKTVGDRQLPVYYVYDSYQIADTLWAEALKPSGKYSIRNGKYDGVFLGLLVESQHLSHLSASGFDGFYTYFGTNGFSYGSSWRNWRLLADKAKKSSLVFVPSIAPGYLDTRVRPWNGANTRLRLKGQYYRNSFQSAMACRPAILSITSFNEWHEGTQVEPAIPKASKGFTYVNYKPQGPEFYLNMTRQFVKEYAANMTHFVHGHDNAF